MATKTTSKKVASTASKILKNDSFSSKSKSVAGSALSQRETTRTASKGAKKSKWFSYEK